MKPEEILSLAEFESIAPEQMSPMALAYVSGGAADELTMHANNEDWRRIKLKPRVLVDVSHLDLSTELFGHKMNTPILLAPAAFHRLFHPDAELATVAGANHAKATMVMSSYATEAVESVTAVAKHPIWFQLYTQTDKELTREMIERAQAAAARGDWYEAFDLFMKADAGGLVSDAEVETARAARKYAHARRRRPSAISASASMARPSSMADRRACRRFVLWST